MRPFRAASTTHALFPFLSLTLALSLPFAAQADDIADVKAGLARLGLKNQGTTLVLPAEMPFIKQLSEITAQQKALGLASKAQKQLDDQAAAANKQLTAAKVEQVRLNAQLANVTDVATNNRIVGTLNALAGQMELFQTQLDEHGEKVKEARAKLSATREKYIDTLLALRKSADELSAEYEQKSADAELPALLEKMKGVTGKTYAVGPTTSFTAALKRLKGYEDTIISESIPLREQGRTYFVSVVVNGKHTEEMVLDSGASMISLPLSLAEKFGLKPSSKDEKIRLELADGRLIEAWRMTLPSVRVGKFSLENVECAVLGPEATRAEALLGMSFLGAFQFEIDSSAKKLTMVKVQGEGKR
jgi:aspartyl protease family protein